MPIGDVASGIDDAAGDRLLDDWLDILKQECTNCWAIRFCSVCFIAAKKGDRFEVERLREHCQRMRSRFDRALRISMTVAARAPRVWQRRFAA